MARIVCVHGIAQQYKGPSSLLDEWLPYLRDGVHHAGGSLDDIEVACASYGELFRPPGRQRSMGHGYDAKDVEEGFESDLLLALWESAASREPTRVPGPNATHRGTPKLVQAALQALSNSKSLSRIAKSVLIGNLKQVRKYVDDPETKTRAQARLHSVVDQETRIIVAHSLGTVVAYEALHRYADDARFSNVTTLITLGSPLGIRNIIFDQLEPRPVNGVGVRPRLVADWSNISDSGDVVALEKRLGPLFEGGITDIEIDNGPTVYDVRPYLSAGETGTAVRAGLGGA